MNWAPQAERDHARGTAPDDFTYLFLGAGLGCAVVSDGHVRRGHGRLAGEGAHRPRTHHHRRLLGPPPRHPGTIVAAAARLPRTVPVRGAELTDNPSLAGARLDALSRLREAIIAAPRGSG